MLKIRLIIAFLAAAGVITAGVYYFGGGNNLKAAETKVNNGSVTQSAVEITTGAIQTAKITTESSVTTSASIKKLVIVVDAANVRDTAGVAGNKIDKIMAATVIDSIDETLMVAGDEWKKIKYGEKTGWVKASSIGDEKDVTQKGRPSFYSKMDLTPQNKVTTGYDTNPRVKAKGIYVTIYSASGKKLDQLIEMTKRTEINAFVIDVKDDNGIMLFNTKAAEQYAPKANKGSYIKDIKAFTKRLKDNNIYMIARIVTFKDPIYTAQHPERSILNKATGQPFTNADNLRWASAYDRELWAYDVAVAKEAAEAGFNEIQFDYVRFPASNGGKLDKQLDYRNTKNELKPEAVQNFLKYAHKELSPLKVYISADVYGLVGSVTDDMALGQHWESLSNVTDYLCPMMYPSHYANGTYKLSVPDAFPYETIYNSTKDGIARNKNIQTPAMIRPWIQDFTAAWVKGHISYREPQVRAQIKALKDNGVEEYLLWNASNRYTESALTK